MARIDRIVERHEQLKRQKNVWNTHWQLLAEYIMTRRSDFTTHLEPGDFVNKELFDSTGSKANRIMSSALIGALWPNGARSFQLNPPDHIPDNVETRFYYDFVVRQMVNAMEHPRAGLVVALEEYMRDQGAFGTSGIAIFKAPEEADNDLTYKAWDVKRMTIDEDENGFVDTVFFEFEWNLLKVVKKYGVNALSAETKEKVADKKWDDKIRILHGIMPREVVSLAKSGALAMPWLSIHIELKNKKLLQESGFEEMPVKVARFIKNIGEKFGRSPGMEALPDILELNAIREGEILATEKLLDPPLAVFDDGFLGGGTIDTSAGALNVFNLTGRLGVDKPIIPLFTVGDMKPTKDRIEELKQSIMDHFFVDKLLDLNNEVQMTLGEAQIRNKLRGDLLTSLFSRQITELFTPLLERTFNILLRLGKLGVIPGTVEEAEIIASGDIPTYIPDSIARSMLKGEDVYKIEYLSPAARMMQAEEVEGIMQAWRFANEMAAARPEVYDNYDEDVSAKRVAKLTGATVILRDQETIKGIRDVREEKAEQIAQQEQMRGQSEVVKNLTGAKR